MFIVDKDISRKIIIFLQMWSQKASQGSDFGKSPLNQLEMSTKLFLQTILKNVTGLKLSYFQFSKYYNSVPEIKNNITKLNQSVIKINLPCEEDHEVETEMPEEPISDQEPEEDIIEPVEPQAATIPDLEQPQQQGPQGPNYKSIVANMAKRARQRNSK